MVKILATPREILCFPKQGLGWEALADQWSGMASRKSPKCCTEIGRFPWAVSSTVLGERDELKHWVLEQPVKTNGCSGIPKGVLLIAKL